MTRQVALSAQIPATAAGQRLDQVLAELFPDYSRSRLQQWVRAGEVLVDGAQRKAKDRVLGGEQIRIAAELEEATGVMAQDITLDVVYEDQDLLVINKPAGMVVHPAAGNPDGTLQNALLHYDASLNTVPRAGIVHRLDKDTSGLLVVARNLTAHQSLVAQLQARTVKREYLALVWGLLVAGGTVDAPIGRHSTDRKRMAVTSFGKPAITHYRIETRYRGHTLVRVNLETGRTHQIRVHMTHLRYPLLGDPVYGGRPRVPAGMSATARAAVLAFNRQALHATRLSLRHPANDEVMEWHAPLPADMVEIIRVLEEDIEGVEED
ncbi:MAG: 23S rRNA pseudouridine(1911/1915/1917) synthase RluD [Gammaproteobacteria bacterium]|nr:23S rRNA pseudouridine(1911/1915/1917) synthase RluD [Gammaproteobacteria bacterium]